MNGADKLSLCNYNTFAKFHPLFQSKWRGAISMKPIIHVAAAVIKGNDESYLIAKRSEQMSLPNVWEFHGGKIEQGENEKIALQREIQEELGCSIEVGSQITDTYHEYEEVIVH